ncbi:hypothetical protein [Pseudobacteriovorax antillogorgiicola]|uniref:Uncharacterized protein n=1 Tax=Pseudobacteriovorax antillogorgiicola TaxID=1513793 RepID=A0A1Y6C233_9BACT|nr:hypothetical protein [Pseudobacteriovorax antillogorgiicola]TCS51175.1 hypothetical protein EDD56_11159 [Pseudobacteriovorax antillogorgiicola]SMF37991.1 hypothetical protein SAMN06296036_111119 [Pseudobacteriovorax antillogorgiicola]
MRLLSRTEALKDYIDAFSDVELETNFAKISHEALENLDIATQLTTDDIYDFLTSQNIAQKNLLTFASPGIALHQGRGFHVVLACWPADRTEIHNHEFEGAFQVLSGSSLDLEFSVSKGKPLIASFSQAKLELTAVQRYGKGDSRQITNDYVHSIFHMDSPTVVLIIMRKNRDFQFVCTGSGIVYPRDLLAPVSRVSFLSNLSRSDSNKGYLDSFFRSNSDQELLMYLTRYIDGSNSVQSFMSYLEHEVEQRSEALRSLFEKLRDDHESALKIKEIFPRLSAEEKYMCTLLCFDVELRDEILREFEDETQVNFESSVNRSTYAPQLNGKIEKLLTKRKGGLSARKTDGASKNEVLRAAINLDLATDLETRPSSGVGSLIKKLSTPRADTTFSDGGSTSIKAPDEL